jgi:hypothetical protein
MANGKISKRELALRHVLFDCVSHAARRMVESDLQVEFLNVIQHRGISDGFSAIATHCRLFTEPDHLSVSKFTSTVNAFASRDKKVIAEILKDCRSLIGPESKAFVRTNAIASGSRSAANSDYRESFTSAVVQFLGESTWLDHQRNTETVSLGAKFRDTLNTLMSLQMHFAAAMAIAELIQAIKDFEEQEDTDDAQTLADMGHVWRVSLGVLERATSNLSPEIPEPVKLIAKYDRTTPLEFVEWLKGVLEDVGG